jgi:hypothetical protein
MDVVTTPRLEHEGSGVAVAVLVTVAVLVGVSEGVYVSVIVGVSVGVLVSVGVFEGVFDGTTNPPPPGLGLATGFTIFAIRKDSFTPARYDAMWIISGSILKIGSTIKVKL